jgi:hypothetical protein
MQMLTRRRLSVNRFRDGQPVVAVADGWLYVFTKQVLERVRASEVPRQNLCERRFIVLSPFARISLFAPP